MTVTMGRLIYKGYHATASDAEAEATSNHPR